MEQKTLDILDHLRSIVIESAIPGIIWGLSFVINCELSGVGYARVSTQEQAQSGISLAAQEDRIRRYFTTAGIPLETIFADRGLSGRRSSNRSGLRQAIPAVCACKGILVVYSLSRMARSTKDAITIVEQIERAGAQLVSISENIDTTSAAGKMFFRIMAVLAEFESDLVSERTKAALHHKKRNGTRWCCDAPYGFRWLRGRQTRNPDEQRVISRMKRLRTLGHSYRSIAERLEKAKITNRAGSPFPHQQIAVILKRDQV